MTTLVGLLSSSTSWARPGNLGAHGDLGWLAAAACSAGADGGIRVGYARVSTDAQDLTAQCDALERLGVAQDRTYVDHGLTSTDRDRPGLRQALAACRTGDELVVTKLDHLARS